MSGITGPTGVNGPATASGTGGTGGEDAKKTQRERLRGMLQGKIKGMSIQRMNAISKNNLYEKECKKAGIDPEQLKKMYASQNK